MIKSGARQSRLVDLRGTKRTIACTNCKMQSTGTIIECYLGTETVDVYNDKIICYPDIRLIACSKCKMKSVLCNGELLAFEDLKDSAEDFKKEIVAAYTEATKCLSSDLYTSTVMNCRKILMLVARDRYADAGKSYEYYINYLEEGGYITKSMKNWISPIRKCGNDANHKTNLINNKDAFIVFMWVAALLCRIYRREYSDGSEFDGFCHH